ncbi:hypothetical protein HJC23_006756 [Cyclotella cryptica]|uniref:Uncharacterized protein n=1 Tax=Cyclotella cryptica TaxID=29204 RepID=A0ABD3PP47_9STRA
MTLTTRRTKSLAKKTPTLKRMKWLTWNVTPTNMPPKKKTVSPKPSDSTKKKPIDDVTESMTKMSVALPVSAVKTPPSVCFDFRFSIAKYTVMDQTTTKIYVELVGCQLPDSSLTTTALREEVFCPHQCPTYDVRGRLYEGTHGS